MELNDFPLQGRAMFTPSRLQTVFKKDSVDLFMYLLRKQPREKLSFSFCAAACLSKEIEFRIKDSLKAHRLVNRKNN